MGLSERFALRGALPFRSIDTSGLFEFSGQELGDLETELMWRLGPELGRGGGALGFGLSLPTAGSAPVDLVEENVFFGTGAVGTLVTLEGYRKLSRSVTLFGSARYRRPLGEGDDNYRFGDDFGYQGTLAWSSPEGRFGAQAGLSNQHLSQDEQDDTPLDNRGGRFHYASIGARFQLPHGLNLGVASSWLVDQDVRGDQLLARRQATLGLSWSWGEHTHDDDDHDEHDEHEDEHSAEHDH